MTRYMLPNSAADHANPGTVFVRRAIQVTVIVVLAMANENAHAQADPRNQRREYVERMLRSLIDSQTGPANNAVPDRASARAEAAASPQLRDVQANLTAMSQELSNLVSQLHADVDRVSGVRTLLGDLLRVSASATVLSGRATTARDISVLRDDYRELDRNWRLLSFRLNQIQGIDNRTKGYVERSNDFNVRLGQLFSIAPQMDRDGLVRQVTQLSNEIVNLVDEIDVEVDDSTKRQELMLDGQRTYAQARRLNRLVSADESHAVIRQEFEEFRRLWTPFANKIRTLDYNSLNRQVVRIRAADRSIQELLWMTGGTDPGELENITTLLQRDISGLFDGISLRQLAQLTNGRDRIITAAGDVYSACGDFAECVKNGDDNNTLAEVYYYLDDGWQRFAALTREIDSRETRQRIREIERAVIELRNAIGVRPTLDRERGVELAGSLENLADHLQGDLERVFAGGGRFPQDFQSRCLLASKEFRNSAKNLNADLVRNPNPRNLRQGCDELTKNWETLVAYTTRLPESEQNHLNAIRRRITPLIVDLQTMFAL